MSGKVSAVVILSGLFLFMYFLSFLALLPYYVGMMP